MNKNLTLGLCVALLLASCAPSAASVGTAIAQTQAAIPTNTPLPTATFTMVPSATPSSTPTPLPTDTAVPTSTNMPSPTATLAATARPALADLALTAKDINGLLGNYYNDTPIPATRQLGALGVETFGEYFFGSSIGSILVGLFRENTATAATADAVRIGGNYLKGGTQVTMRETLNDTATLVHQTKPDDLILVVAQGEVCVLIDFSLGKGATADNSVPFMANLGLIQMDRLARGGYGK